MDFLMLLVGFVLLIKGADYFVEGSSSLAKIFKIPTVIIGLTVVAMGTSAPEASVSLNAALAGANDIAISNVIGSNIFNSVVVVGVCAMMSSFVVDKDIARRDLPINVFITIVLVLMMLDGKLTRIEGIILSIGIVSFIIVMVVSALKNRSEVQDVEQLPLWKSLLFIGCGLAAVIFGGDVVVDSATAIATMFGLSQNFIGLTIIAVGTSLPELVTSIVASRKGESGLALGNAVGSNIFNILFILGMSASISPLNVASESIIDGIVLIVIAITLLIMAKTKGKMDRKEGLVCVLIYIVYTMYLLMR